MDLNEIIKEKFEVYKSENGDEFVELRHSLECMQSDLIIKTDKYFVDLKKDFSEFDQINSFEKLGVMLQKLLIDPLMNENLTLSKFESTAWSSFVNPTVVNPNTDFQKFYEHVEYFYFIHRFIFDKTISIKTIVSEVGDFFFRYTVRETFIIVYKEIYKLIPNSDSNPITENYILNTVILIVRHMFQAKEFKDSIYRSTNFDKLRESFLTNLDNKNIEFRNPEQSFKSFYDQLEKDSLVTISYSEFRTLLIIEDSKFADVSFNNKIRISLEHNYLQIMDIGNHFSNLKTIAYKGNKEAFVKWIQKNFVIVKKNGQLASMSSYNLKKMV